MKNKKDIATLIGSIVGETKIIPATDEKGNIPEEVIDSLGITPELVEKLHNKRRNKVGRPNKYSQAEVKEREHRATFVVSSDLTRKVKYISLMEGELLKDIIADALSQYIKKWEDINGVINLPKNKGYDRD